MGLQLFAKRTPCLILKLCTCQVGCGHLIKTASSDLEQDEMDKIVVRLLKSLVFDDCSVSDQGTREQYAVSMVFCCM